MAPTTAGEGGRRKMWLTRGAGRSDVGRVRKENQDAYGLYPAAGLYVVSDGVGGHLAGSLASRMAVDELHRAFVRTDEADLTPVTDPAGHSSVAGRRLVIAIQDANQQIRESSRDPSRHGMGATVVATAFDQAHGVVAICHVGDSRVYRVRGGVAEQLTEDHTMVQQWVREGRIEPEEAAASPHRHMITQALGSQDVLQPTLRLEVPASGDVFVLTSDGVHDVVPAEEIASVVTEAGDDVELASFRLVDLANERGGKDNSTVVLVQCVGPFGTGKAASQEDDEPTVEC